MVATLKVTVYSLSLTQSDFALATGDQQLVTVMIGAVVFNKIFNKLNDSINRFAGKVLLGFFGCGFAPFVQVRSQKNTIVFISNLFIIFSSMMQFYMYVQFT